MRAHSDQAKEQDYLQLREALLHDGDSSAVPDHGLRLRFNGLLVFMLLLYYAE